MFKAETVYILFDDGLIIGVFESREAIDKFIQEEFNAEDYFDRDWFDTNEEYEEAIEEANEAIAAKQYYKLDYYIGEYTMYKEV